MSGRFIYTHSEAFCVTHCVASEEKQKIFPGKLDCELIILMPATQHISPSLSQAEHTKNTTRNVIS